MTPKRLKNTSPAELLATALDNTLIPLSHLASKARITPFHAERAIRGRLVTTGPYLRLCVALGLNPLPEVPHAEPVLGDFDSVMLAMRLRLHRNFNDRSVVEAASESGLQIDSLSRLERADRMAIHYVLKACRYVGIHPFDLLGKNGITVDISKLGFPARTVTESGLST